MFQDRTLTCADCGESFVFSASEQEFYRDKGYDNDPKRCLSCRQQRKQQKRSSDRPMYDAVCAECGMDTKVPFQPTGERPVFCSDCFKAKKDRY